LFSNPVSIVAGIADSHFDADMDSVDWYRFFDCARLVGSQWAVADVAPLSTGETVYPTEPRENVVWERFFA